MILESQSKHANFGEKEMEMESNKISEDPRLLAVLTNMASEIEKLENLPKELADLDNRLSSLEKRSEEAGKFSEFSGNTFDKDLELKDIRISELESRRAILESPEYRENLILE